MDKYTPPQIDRMLDSMVVIIDTREQDTLRLRRRIQDIGLPCMRKALPYGDYSASFTDVDGSQRSLERIAAIERKKDLSELCINFTTGRKRFAKEFGNAKKDGCHMYLLIENESYDSLYSGEYQRRKYGSKLPVNCLSASLKSWQARYGVQVEFCNSELTGRLIKEILHYELREYLQNQQVDEQEGEGLVMC